MCGAAKHTHSKQYVCRKFSCQLQLKRATYEISDQTHALKHSSRCIHMAGVISAAADQKARDKLPDLRSNDQMIIKSTGGLEVDTGVQK
jgi:hypothetical protein